ncbi:MAG: hypothetical protein Q9212_002782 [Teloschistes hypoglaucus]
MSSPLDMASRHDLEDTFNAMRPHFEDKETEQNWQLREKDVAKLRRITTGNAPKDYRDTYLTGIKSLLEGIIKVIKSLRTTVSATGCDLIQDMAQERAPGMDNMSEIVLPHLVKLCASTKKIAAAKAEATVTIVITCISYNIFLMKLIWAACEDKNVQPRKAATGWLKTLVAKHRDNKVVFEKGEGLSLLEKCLKKGLADSNPDVRKAMRATYWAFIRLWPERVDNILSALSEQHRKVLITETAETDSVPAPAKAKTIAAAKTTAPQPKPSIKEAIAAKRQAVKVEKAVDTSSTNTTATTRPTAAATRTLSSAPMRPSRMMRKPTNPEKGSSISTTEGAETRPDSIPEAAKATSPDSLKSAPLPKSPMAAKAPSPDSSKSAPLPKSPMIPVFSHKEAVARKAPEELPEAAKAPSPDSSKYAPSPNSPMKPIFSRKEAVARKAPEELPESAKAPSPDSSKSAPLPKSPMKTIFSRKEAVARKALEELPVNEPRALPLSKMGHYEEDKMRLTREKWKYVERFQMERSRPTRRDGIETIRKSLRARIQHLKGCNGVSQDFRAIQATIRGSRQVLDSDAQLFDELLFTLLELMESDQYCNFRIDEVGEDHNTQLLITLRILLCNHKDLVSAYLPRILCAIVSAARGIDDDTHMAVALEDTVLEVVEQCDVGNLEDSIDSLLDFLESEDYSEFGQTLGLGFFALTKLMFASDNERLCRPLTQEERLGALAAQGLKNTFAEIRHAACQFAVEFQNFLQDEDRFWEYISPTGTDRMYLVAYFLSKMEVAEQMRVEGECWERTFGGQHV